MGKIKILGVGKAPRHALSTYQGKLTFQLCYKDTKLSEQYDYTFLCASVNEAKLAQRRDDPFNRMTVALPNIEIVEKLLKQGHFDSGIIFVLTNPSEIVAEFIYRKTGNRDVYALGPEVDAQRLNTKEIGGNHYDRPLGYSDETLFYINGDFEKQASLLQEKIRSEFLHLSPPYLSGGRALCESFLAIENLSSLRCSGFCEEFDSFCAGSLNLKNLYFTPSLGNSEVSRSIILETISRHKKRMSEFL